MRRVLILTAAVTATAALVAGCANSGYNYVKSSEDKTYFKVPSDWKLYDEDAILQQLPLSDREESVLRDNVWQVGFDASPKPSVKNANNAGTGSSPSGVAFVQPLTEDISDRLSTAAMRNLFLPLTEAETEDRVQYTINERLQPDGGFRGIRVAGTVDVPVDDNGDKVDDRVITTSFDQTVLVDQATSKVYALFVACKQRCFDENRSEITKVGDSWTVRAK